MGDERIELIAATANHDCPNCGTNQLNRFTLYWNETQGRLEVDKVCVCQDVSDTTLTYKEQNAVSAPEL